MPSNYNNLVKERLESGNDNLLAFLSIEIVFSGDLQFEEALLKFRISTMFYVF